MDYGLLSYKERNEFIPFTLHSLGVLSSFVTLDDCLQISLLIKMKVPNRAINLQPEATL